MNFRGHELVEAGPRRLELRPTLQFHVFAGAFVAAGALLGVGAVFFAGMPEVAFGALFPSLGALVFGGAGVAMLVWARRPRVLDADVGWFWIGSERERDVARRRGAVKLSRVRAVQLLGEEIESSSSDGGSDSSFTSWEINLVLDDGSRTCLVDQAGERAARQDAARIAGLLGVPLHRA